MKYRARAFDRELTIDLRAAPESADGEAAFEAALDGRPPVPLLARFEGDTLLLRLDGRLWRVVLARALPGAHVSAASVHGETVRVDLEVEGARASEGPRSKAASLVRVASTMPGRVMSVPVAVGDFVERGDLLLTLEAMKMQNEFVSPTAGRVVGIHTAAGQVAAAGDVLVEIDPAGARP